MADAREPAPRQLLLAAEVQNASMRATQHAGPSLCSPVLIPSSPSSLMHTQTRPSPPTPTTVATVYPTPLLTIQRLRHDALFLIAKTRDAGSPVLSSSPSSSSAGSDDNR